MVNINIGDTIVVRGGFGRELPETVTVVNKGDEDGRVVIDYIDGSGRKRWAYLYQVERESIQGRAAA